MPRIEHSIDIDAPAGLAYGQWTLFESIPEFARGVREVRQLDDRHLRWHLDIIGIREMWEAEIVDQVPDRRVSWRSTTGAPNSGTVTFEPLSDDASRLTLSLAYEPQGLAENVGDRLGFVDLLIVRDLERFKALLEQRHVRSPLRATAEELVGQ